MFFQRFYDTKLAQASYLIGCQRTGEAVVVDPNRDVEQYVDAAAKEGLRVTHVTETHIHADFVSGARELAASGVGYLAHGLVDHLVDGHSAAVDVLDDEAEDLEDLLFSDAAQGGDLQRRSFELRKALTSLRRAVLPMRDVLAVMQRPELGLADERMTRMISSM